MLSAAPLETVDPRSAPGIEAEIPYVGAGVDRIVMSYTDTSFDFTVERRRVHVRNGRLANPPPSLDREGFLLVEHPSDIVRYRRAELIAENALHREDVPAINDAYAAELAPFIKRLSGARDVVPQFSTTQIRFSNRAAHRSWLTTAAFAHLDFAPAQARMMVDMTLEVTGQVVAPYSRHALIQTWRVITEPPQDMPLAICDGRSVSTAEMIPMEFHGPEGSRNAVVQSRVCSFEPLHQWTYFPAMTPDEVLVFKGFDSACPDAMNAMHTAFDDETVVRAVPRGSIECRFIALYD